MHLEASRMHAPSTLHPPAQAERPRKPRPHSGPEGPWWNRPVRPQ